MPASHSQPISGSTIAFHFLWFQVYRFYEEQIIKQTFILLFYHICKLLKLFLEDVFIEMNRKKNIFHNEKCEMVANTQTHMKSDSFFWLVEVM